MYKNDINTKSVLYTILCMYRAQINNFRPVIAGRKEFFTLCWYI